MTSKTNLLSGNFTPPHPLNTAVLFIVFNRPEPTKRVFAEIQKAKPPRIYLACDGVREHKEGEKEKVQAVRDYITQNINWECEVKTLFQDKNLGCKYGEYTAMDWFFQNEEKGIIIEDDCLPSQSFFWFCEELLERYKNNGQIGHIGGSNFQNGIKRGSADYYYSIFNHGWGWAGWADRWHKYYNVNIDESDDLGFVDTVFEDKASRLYWKQIFRQMQHNQIDTWDYQWTYALWKNKQLSILPSVNLVTNIGFGEDAVHTKNKKDKFSNMKRFELVLEKHPNKIEAHKEADKYTMKKVFLRRSSLPYKIARTVKRAILKFISKTTKK